MTYLLLLPLLYGLIILLSHVFQDKMLFLPTRLSAQYNFEFEENFEEVLLDRKGQLLDAVFFPQKDSSRGLILYFHGNADDLQRWGRYAVDFTHLGFEVMMIDYPGYGKSEGKPSEKAFYESAKLAYDWAREKYTAEDIIIYGRSIGSGPASFLATQEDARMLILETPFYSMRDVLDRRFPTIFPFDLKHEFPVNQHLERRKMEEAYIFQGTEDETVPYASAIKLRPLLADESHFITIEGGKHKNLAEFEEFHTALEKILR
ncbi:MAG: alpha/beta hydrolase [Bacteroidota bacterium]